MNVLFHTTASIAVSSEFASRERIRFRTYVSVFLIGILLHGIMDILPHTYPVKSVYDVILSLSAIVIAALIVKPEYRLLYVVSFLGSIFPDATDLGPRLLFKAAGAAYNVPMIFPWHGPLSGSIYGRESYFSLFTHAAVMIVTGFLIFKNFRYKESDKAGQ